LDCLFVPARRLHPSTGREEGKRWREGGREGGRGGGGKEGREGGRGAEEEEEEKK
jgi:hypothetical protein